MGIADLSIKRPVATLMAVIVVIILGFVSLSRIPVDLLPDVELPVAVIITAYPGASSEEIESLVTKPIEEQIANVENIKRIASTTEPNVSIITVSFNWGTDLDFAAMDIREKVDIVKKNLPDGAEDPVVSKLDPSMMPILSIGMVGDRDTMLMKQIAEDQIVKKLERIEGVSSINIIGGVEREIRVKVSQQKMDGYGVALSQVIQALKAGNLNVPGGEVDFGGRELIVRTTGEFENIDEIKNLVVVNRQGTIIRLIDIATVEDATEDVKTVSRINEHEGLRLLVQKQSDANTVRVATQVKKELKNIEKELPKGIELYEIFDQSDYINRAVNNVKSSAIQGAILAVIVIFLFLQNAKSTMVIALSIPISIIATFVAMYFMGLSVNLMSLGGLAIGVGMLVDNSIVVLENIYRHQQELGRDKIEAASKGAGEVTLAIGASTLTTIAVFLPIVFIEGISGIIFKELSLTITFSLISSIVVAVTIVPLLSSRLVDVKAEEKRKKERHPFLQKVFKRTNEYYDLIDEKYGEALNWALSHRKLVILTIVGMLAISVAFVPLIGTEFFPETDEGKITVDVELPLSSKLENTNEVMLHIEEIVAGIPEVRMYSSQIGTTTIKSFLGTTSGEIGSMDIRLVPLKERDRSTKDVVEEIREKVGEVPGATIEIKSATMTSRVGSVTSGDKPVQVAIKGDDFETLEDLSENILEIVRKVPGTRDVETTLDEGRPEVKIKVDKNKASFYDLDASSVALTVRAAVNGAVATQYKVAGTEIDVNVQIDDLSRQTYEDLKMMTIMSPKGSVPLRNIASFEVTEGPNQIKREDQERMVYVNADLYKRSLGSVIKDIDSKLAGMSLPEGYSIKFEGQNKEMEEAFEELTVAMALAVVLVYAVMASQFESLLHPFTIMFSLPFAGIGVVLGLFISRRSFSVPAFMGAIMLAGIAVNNAIVLVDYINQLRAQGMTVREAIVAAGPTRLRAIMMTTLTTVLGLLPLALGIGEGGEIQAPLAVVVMGGLIVSTLLTLIVVPVLYSIFEDLNTSLKNIFSNRKNKSSAHSS